MTAEETDPVRRRVRGQLLTGAAEARGALDRFLTAPEDREPVCRCGHGQSAHHGEDGELYCGEADCNCERFEQF